MKLNIYEERIKILTSRLFLVLKEIFYSPEKEANNNMMKSTKTYLTISIGFVALTSILAYFAFVAFISNIFLIGIPILALSVFSGFIAFGTYFYATLEINFAEITLEEIINESY